MTGAPAAEADERPVPPELPGLTELPAAVRSRVLALAAEVLPEVVRLPPALRQVATFTAARRARLGGPALEVALADDDFRAGVGVLVAARPESESGGSTRAARLWLVRPDGLADAWSAALAALSDVRSAEPGAADRIARLTDQVATLQRAEHELRGRHKSALQKLKDDNVDLRRKLGESRLAERSARERADSVTLTSEAALAAAAAATAAAEADVRRLRAQVAELRASASRGRSDARADRDDASMRARLLLDTVIDAASGLQRELGLRGGQGAPADRVVADVPEQGVRTGADGLEASSPARLEQLLGLPRAHLVVDGYNVSKTGWPSASLERQRSQLLTGLAALVARTRAEVTVVFDAAAVGPRPVVTTPRGVRVVFSPEGVIADDVIRAYVAAEPPGRVLVVATNDRAVVQDVVRAGARAASSEALVGLLAR
jgi:predicted RNA-binding protein with PIN domain